MAFSIVIWKGPTAQALYVYKGQSGWFDLVPICFLTVGQVQHWDTQGAL